MCVGISDSSWRRWRDAQIAAELREEERRAREAAFDFERPIVVTDDCPDCERDGEPALA